MNITMSLDDALLSSARRIAFERDTSVTELIRNYLSELVEGANRGRKSKADALLKTFEQNSVRIEKSTWTREELHARN